METRAGVIRRWHPHGWGLISDDNERLFFAHASQFVDGKCEIKAGMRVEFSPKAKRPQGKFPIAREIKVQPS